MNELAAKKIKMMKGSVRCLVFGLVSFLPGIGVPFALAALVTSGGVRRYEKELWNAARDYRVIGITCATVSLVIWFLVAAVITIIAINSNCDGCLGA